MRRGSTCLGGENHHDPQDVITRTRGGCEFRPLGPKHRAVDRTSCNRRNLRKPLLGPPMSQQRCSGASDAPDERKESDHEWSAVGEHVGFSIYPIDEQGHADRKPQPPQPQHPSGSVLQGHGPAITRDTVAPKPLGPTGLFRDASRRVTPRARPQEEPHREHQVQARRARPRGSRGSYPRFT